MIEKEDIEKYLDLIHTRAVNLNRLIEDLFQLTKFDLKSLSYKFSNIHIEQLARKIKDKFETDVYNANLQFNITNKFASNRQPYGEIPSVCIDVDRIDQVFTNIIFNAIKYTPEEGTITVTFESSPDEKEAIVKISDNGQV